MQIAGGRGVRFFHTCGWVALSVYIFSWLFSLDVSRAAEVVFVLCFIVCWFYEPAKKIKFHWIFLVFLAFVGLQAFVYLFAADRFPQFADGQVKAARHVAKLFLCIAVAWWVRGSVRASVYLASLFVAGFFFALLVGFDASEWLRGLQGSRVDFGFTNAQHTSVYFAMALVLSACWFWHGLHKRYSLLALLLPAALVILSVIGVFITQTRAVWLACFLTLLSAGILAVLLSRRKVFTFVFSPKGRVASVIFAIVVMLFSWQFLPLIEKRMEAEDAVIESIVSGSLEDVPYSSIGIRIHTWHYAIEKIRERPLTGWGAESRKPLIDEGPFPDHVRERFGHFHNGYIDITLAYGLIGFGLLSILTVIALKGVSRLWGAGQPILFFGLLASWALFFIVNIFESYVIFRTGMYIYLVLGGIGVSFYLFGVKRHE
ncbi:O-antigen ligase family protein [Onishia niordana]|uniref:O-antigen ligase family protein n=1 Tax=Onishia niordana TaxID=2508711 RepID=UPI001445C948|nr:O-antigen ligase family protein [Halomonas niordiana]